ncbi:fasciclin domain-containing protein [Acetobacter lambici]|uniref:Fasciclin domain-containing protein n=2 Tax=Acetobacter lambici TaxID=1332824 RepID=A0ABT1EXP6_9PROT|nr:fasciclin domain-containing protein [Acetobacter lambici]MCP1257707.1 fasciclin domain-containing protein [Acetobacter lambici]
MHSHPPRHAPLRWHGLAAPRVLALAGMIVLGGCQQSSARQDTYLTPISTCSYMMPTVSGTRTYTRGRSDASAPATNQKNPVDSAVAYSNPQTPAFCDRPLSDTLRSSIELADYTHLLDSTGLFATLQQAGPFTVFALPNNALETYNAQNNDRLLNPANTSSVRTMLGYTIVTGKWPHKALRAAMDAAPGHSLSLPTLSGRNLTIWLDPQTDQIMVGTPHGSSSQLWVMGIPQSNGVLYFTRSLLLPPTAQAAPLSPAP